MDKNVLKFIEIFTNALQGEGGIGLFLMGVYLLGLIGGFISCMIITVIDEIMRCVIPFFRRKMERFNINKNSKKERKENEK